VTDCTVLQQHSIHPATVQVKLQGNRSGKRFLLFLSAVLWRIPTVSDLLVPSRPRMERRSSLTGGSHVSYTFVSFVS